jgi:periplasmic protein TonB
MGYQALLFCPDEKTARTVTQVLSDLDFTVEPCTEPFAAVKKLMAQRFDAVVVDCDNEQNATLLFKSAHTSNSNQSSLAVAVVEGQAGVAKAFRIGANLVLTKPINVEQAKGTLRVARGLLRKGSEAPKAATLAASVRPASQVAAPTKPPVPQGAPLPASQNAPAARSFVPQSSSKPSIPSVPVPKSPAAPVIPSVTASTHVVNLDDQDSDAILEADEVEPTTAQPVSETRSPALAATSPVAGTPKFPWQPSAKMAEPMASALRRAAEAAGQVEPAEATPVKAPAVPPATEKRPMSGAMFQAQGHATTPALALEKPSLVAAAAAPVVEEAPVVSKPAVREASEPKLEKPAVDTTLEDVPPPTFFPGAYDPDEAGGGGKAKAIVIVATVVLLASSAGYLSWKNSSKSAPASPTTQSAATTPVPVQPADTSTPRDPASASQPVATDITLGGTATSPSAPASRPTGSPKPSPASTKPSPKESAPAPAAEPEVTQRLIVRNDTRHMSSKPTRAQDQESVQAPSAIGMEGSADTKALASISSAPVNVPRPSPQMLRVSQGVMEGLVLKRVQPRYPTQAMQMRIQGPVQLQATITKNGDIANLKVVSGDAVLARAAQEAVQQWKYKPYFLNGEPVQIETQILVNFKLPN